MTRREAGENAHRMAYSSNQKAGCAAGVSKETQQKSALLLLAFYPLIGRAARNAAHIINLCSSKIAIARQRKRFSERLARLSASSSFV